METITKKITYTIESGNKTIKDLADYLGVTTRQITRWKSGTSEMGIYKLQKFCEFYDVSADYILGLPEHAQYIKR